MAPRQFAIVIHHRDAQWDALSATRQAEILAGYFAWHRGLQERGAVLGAVSLKDSPGRVIRVVDGEVVDGLFTETKEIVGGFVMVTAPDWESAQAMARDCPALQVGDWVELRELSDLFRPAT